MFKKIGIMLVLLASVFAGCAKEEAKDTKVTVKYQIPDDWKEITVNKKTVKLVNGKNTVKIFIDRLAEDSETTSEEVIKTLKNQIVGTMVKNKVEPSTYKISRNIKDVKIAEEEFKAISYLMNHKETKVIQNFYSAKIDNTLIRIDTISESDDKEKEIVELINKFEFKTVGEA
ncbi:MAG: hypothetical protein N4A47_00395 [Clostridia bacterium]|jgi:uncharacterized lipoprotein|nr:hypothetical protein [Clostridia bacterium]